MRREPSPDRSPDRWLVLLAVSGLAFWFVVGLPWGPHNESFDWVVRLEQRSFVAALFEKFPSVLSLRPLGTGAAWVLYRLGHHDVALAELVNALLAVLAWAWVVAGARERRLFALLAFGTGAVFFAGYIWVFHLHGIFYGPLLVFLAALLRAASRPPDLRDVLGVFVGALVVALAHPYSLPLVIAFAIGATVEASALRTRPGAAALAAVLSGSAAAYFLLVPGYNRGIGGEPIAGFMASYRTLEVNRIGSIAAGLLAAWTATRALPGPSGMIAGALTLAVAGLAHASGFPVLPLWIVWAIVKSLRHRHWTLAAVLGTAALLPVPNPTGSPTYAIFAVFAAVCATALDETRADRALRFLRPASIGIALLLLLATAIALRAGIRVPVIANFARPLLAEGERTRQFARLVDGILRSPARDQPARFLHSAANPAEVDAVDRRFRPPTEDAHLATWLDWKRGGPPGGQDTLLLTFGGESVPGHDTVLVVRGRYAGDALVLRRSRIP